MRRSPFVCSLFALSACFNPEDPASTGDTDASSGADATTPTSAPTDPSDPSNTDPSDTDPSDTDPSDTDPSDTDPSDTDPSDTDPSDTDPSDTDSADSTSTGEPAACADGNADPGELCLGDADVFNVGVGAFDIAIADFDGVGGLDIATLNREASTVSILNNDGTGGFGNADSHTVGDGSCRLKAIDGDGDDDIDIVISGDPIVTLNNDGAGDFDRVNAPFGAGSFGGCGDYHDMDVLNNGGGPVDIVYSGEYNNSFVAGISNAQGWTFADNATAVNNAGEGSAGLTVTELGYDPDNNADVIQLNRYSTTGTIFRGNGSGGFVQDGTFSACEDVGDPKDYINARWAAAGDLNGDGQTDIVTSCIDGQDPGPAFTMVFGAANGTFSAETVVALDGAYRVVLPDIDLDGDLDMLVATSVAGGVAIFLNDGTGVFAEPIGLDIGGPAYNVAVADLNADGALDVAIPHSTGQGGRVAVYFANP
jgi:hypothetical protein